MILLDTHALHWWTHDLKKLPPQLLQTLRTADVATNLAVSSISLCEIAVKCAKGKLDLQMTPEQYFQKLELSGCISFLAVTVHDWLLATKLDWTHKDNVDRVLVATAQNNNASLATADQQITSFYDRVLWE